MEEQNERVLCVKEERYGTLDIWVCPKGAEDRIVITSNGKPIEQFECNMPINPKALDNYMGMFGRDVENWYYKDIVIHWGVHQWKFYNSKNVTKVENVKTLEGISYLYDVEV